MFAFNERSQIVCPRFLMFCLKNAMFWAFEENIVLGKRICNLWRHAVSWNFLTVLLNFEKWRVSCFATRFCAWLEIVTCVSLSTFTFWFYSIFSWYGLNRISKMHVEKKSELRSLLKSGDKRCKLVEPRNAKSCVWRFFNLVSCDDRIEPYACCKTCGDLLSYSGKTGTGSLLRHRCLHTTNGKFGSDIHARPLTLPRVFRAGSVVVVIATVCPSVVIYTECFHLKQ